MKENLSDLILLDKDRIFTDETAISALRQDKVVLIQNVSPSEADSIMAHVAAKFSLLQNLKLQANFASLLGHRERSGEYFMTVNKRNDYEVIPPHSEGTEKTNLQLACLFCLENTTDGGASILFNTNNESLAWKSLYGVGVKVALGGRTLASAEQSRLRHQYRIELPDDLIGDDDRILKERESPMPSIRSFSTLSRAIRRYSVIANRECYSYWDNIASADFTSGEEFLVFLEHMKLLKKPEGWNINRLDNSYPRRVWRSNVAFKDIFKSFICRKLAAHEMIIMNNRTWTHSTSNWTPGVGNRRVFVAFA